MHVLTFVKAARNCTELLEHGELSRAFHPGTRLRSSANWRANYNSQTCLSIFFSSSLWIVPQRRFAPRNLLDPLRSGFRSIRGELIVRLIARLFVWTRSLCLEISERSEGILRICDDVEFYAKEKSCRFHSRRVYGNWKCNEFEYFMISNQRRNILYFDLKVYLDYS